jgi:nucleotide-binding universal stress UspA family protein
MKENVVKARTVVIGYDGSADSREALDAAIEFVADDGVVHVVTAFDPASRREMGRALEHLPDEYRHTYDLEETPRGYLRVAEAVLEEQGVTHVGHFIEDHPASAILDVAREVEADLIVIGTRGLGRVERFLRGSVSASVANHARTSLMMIHSERTVDAYSA